MRGSFVIVWFYRRVCSVVVLAGVMGCALLLLEAGAAGAQTGQVDPQAINAPGLDRSAKPGLKIASWNLSDAAVAGGFVRQKPKRKVWRNTFVPRGRVSSGEVSLNKTVGSADIVLLQGVNSIREARRFFPARKWKLIVSREVLKVAGGRGPFPKVMPADFVTTAIAVRYQLGVRVTGQEHLLVLSRDGEDTSADGGGTKVRGPAVEAGLAAATESVRDSELFLSQAGLAVRVYREGVVIWFVSVAFGTNCLKQAECLPRDSLNAWISDKRDYDIPVIVGGRFYIDSAGVSKVGGKSAGDAKSAGAKQHCRHQTIVLDARLDGAVTHDGTGGCIALATLKN